MGFVSVSAEILAFISESIQGDPPVVSEPSSDACVSSAAGTSSDTEVSSDADASSAAGASSDTGVSAAGAVLPQPVNTHSIATDNSFFFINIPLFYN